MEDIGAGLRPQRHGRRLVNDPRRHVPAAADALEELRKVWCDATKRSRAAVHAALAEGDLGQPARRKWPDGRAPSLRRILCHMIEEYARHNGHVDLMREVLDGLTGE